jgi:hypothetical protein
LPLQQPRLAAVGTLSGAFGPSKASFDSGFARAGTVIAPRPTYPEIRFAALRAIFFLLARTPGFGAFRLSFERDRKMRDMIGSRMNRALHAYAHISRRFAARLFRFPRRLSSKPKQ